MLLLIDNYDSFTYNLAQYMGLLGEEIKVVRNDQMNVADLEALYPQRIVISPGPGIPDNAGISKRVIERFSGSVPILGVCLGHQCIGEAFGYKVEPARELVHGKTSVVHHTGEGIFAGLPPKIMATRYHSLALADEPGRHGLKITARTSDGTIMAVQHETHPTYGVQFHPESIATEYGLELLQSFLRL